MKFTMDGGITNLYEYEEVRRAGPPLNPLLAAPPLNPILKCSAFCNAHS